MGGGVVRPGRAWIAGAVPAAGAPVSIDAALSAFPAAPESAGSGAVQADKTTKIIEVKGRIRNVSIVQAPLMVPSLRLAQSSRN